MRTVKDDLILKVASEDVLVYPTTTEDQLISGWTQSFEMGNDKWRYRKFPGNCILCEGSVNSRACTSHGASGGYQGIMNFPFTFKNAPAVLAVPVYALGYPKVVYARIAIYKRVRCIDRSNGGSWIAQRVDRCR